MSKATKIKVNFLGFILSLLALGLIVSAALFLFAPVDMSALDGAGYGSGTVRARVVEIIEEGIQDLGGISQPYQIMRIEILEGDYRGILLEIDYGKRQVRAQGISFSPGDEILVTIGVRPDNMVVAYYTEYVRQRQLLILLGIFIACIILISRWKGVRSLLAMGFSLLVIIMFIIPRILAGQDPVLVSVIGAGVLLTVTLYVTYGWNLKTHSSVLGMLAALALTGMLAWFFVDFVHLTGYGSEDALFLLQIEGMQIDLRGLLLGGMIIGALGVLDDLVTTQSSAVFELHGANPGMGFQPLFSKAMRIGQDHVAATVNTLVLAYAGASLPMLLLFALGRGSYVKLVNFEFVAEEIVRTLVGSLGLIAAVPITTVIAAWMVMRVHPLGGWRAYLGPRSGGEDHGHTH